MKDGSSNNYLVARKECGTVEIYFSKRHLQVNVSAYFRIRLCCTEPKSLTTNGPTHRGHTCRSLDATFFPDALCMQLLLYSIMLMPVESFPVHPRSTCAPPHTTMVVINQPESGRPRRFVGMGT